MQYPKYYPTGLKDCESEVPRGEGSTRMGFEIGLKGEGLLFREYGRLNSRPGFVFDYAAAVFPFGVRSSSKACRGEVRKIKKAAESGFLIFLTKTGGL